VTRDFAGPAWRDHGRVVVVPDLSTAYQLAEEFAYEHVQVLVAEPREALDRMRNYGALFLGEGTCVSYGDKVIGTNHTLPTRGAARYTGGLWVGKFLMTVTYQLITDQSSSAALGQLCGRAARVESFEGTPAPATCAPPSTPGQHWTGRQSTTRRPRFDTP